jgi:hypothetical protein
VRDDAGLRGEQGLDVGEDGGFVFRRAFGHGRSSLRTIVFCDENDRVRRRKGVSEGVKINKISEH